MGALRDRAADVPAVMHKRIVERVQQLAAQVALDPARVAQEAAFLAAGARLPAVPGSGVTAGSTVIVLG